MAHPFLGTRCCRYMFSMPAAMAHAATRPRTSRSDAATANRLAVALAAPMALAAPNETQAQALECPLTSRLDALECPLTSWLDAATATRLAAALVAPNGRQARALERALTWVGPEAPLLFWQRRAAETHGQADCHGVVGLRLPSPAVVHPRCTRNLVLDSASVASSSEHARSLLGKPQS